MFFLPVTHFHLAFIALVITCIERLTGNAPKVSPRYPIVREAGSPFAVIQYPAHDVDLDILFTQIPTRKARQAYAARSNQSPV